MTRTLFYLITALCITATTYAQDIIVFKNGDVLTGTILEQTDQHVYFKSGAFGSVSLSPRNIATIHTDEPEPSTTALLLDAISKPEPTPPAPKKEVAKKVQLSEVKKWSGKAGLSIAMRESNTIRRVGDKLTEINLTSPTGIREINRLYDVRLEGLLLDCVERRHADSTRTP